MSVETHRICDMSDCQGGNIIYVCEKCTLDVCSLCSFDFYGKKLCWNCAVKNLYHSDIREILKKMEKKKEKKTI